MAIIWTLPIGTLGTNFSEILIEIYSFTLKVMHLKIVSAKSRPFCLGLNVVFTHAVPGWETIGNNNAWVISRNQISQGASCPYNSWRCNIHL